MNINNWEGVALIIGSGGIGKAIFEHLSTNSPLMDVILCGRNIIFENDICLDLENDESFRSFKKYICFNKKPFRLVINTSGFLHLNILKPEKKVLDVNHSNLLKNFAINAFPHTYCK